MRVFICLIVAAWAVQGVPSKTLMTVPPIEEAVRTFPGEAGLFAVNLRTGQEIAVNADLRFPTASAIKTAVMVEAYHQAAAGLLSFDDAVTVREADKVGGSGVLNGLSEGLSITVRDAVYLMIVVSDNTATNLVVNRLGTAKIDERMVAFGLQKTKIFRPTFRDGRPDIYPELEREFGLGMSTPREMAMLMARIAGGQAVSRDASSAMLATLERQQDRAMIPRLLPSGVRVGNKTGTDSEKLPDASGKRGAIRTDAAIVRREGFEYALAIFTRRGADTRDGVENAGVVLGGRLSKMVFDLWSR